MVFLIALALDAADPPAFSAPRRAFGDCVESAALQYEPAGESVDATVDIAFEACLEEQLKYAEALARHQEQFTERTEDEKTRLTDRLVAIEKNVIRSRTRIKLMGMRANRGSGRADR